MVSVSKELPSNGVLKSTVKKTSSYSYKGKKVDLLDDGSSTANYLIIHLLTILW